MGWRRDAALKAWETRRKLASTADSDEIAERTEPVYLVKRYAEFVPKEKKKLVPSGTRGIYALLKKGATRVAGKSEATYRVVYVGMSDGHVHGRLNSHARSKSKRDAWDYFSVFEVWRNIPEGQIKDLEGLFRHIYRKDPKANAYNVIGGYNKLKPWKVSIESWKGNRERRSVS